MNEIVREKRDDQKESIVSYFGYKQPDDFIWTTAETPANQVIHLKMIVARLPAFSAGNKLFISQRMSRLWTKSLPRAENRKLDYYFRSPFEKTDTTIYKLIAGMKPDALPAAKELNCDYASYRSKCWYDGQQHAVVCATTLVLKQHKIPAAAYAQVKAFFDGVVQDDSQKIVIQKTADSTEKKAF